jgi:hypothetical protein
MGSSRRGRVGVVAQDDTRLLGLLEEGREHLLDRKCELENGLRGAQGDERTTLKSDLTALRSVLEQTDEEIRRLRPAVPCQEGTTLLVVTPLGTIFTGMVK